MHLAPPPPSPPRSVPTSWAPHLDTLSTTAFQNNAFFVAVPRMPQSSPRPLSERPRALTLRLRLCSARGKTYLRLTITTIMRAKDRETTPRNGPGKDGDKKDGDAVDPQQQLSPERVYVSIHPKPESSGETSCHSHDGTTRLSERGLALCGLESHWSPPPIWNSPNDQR